MTTLDDLARVEAHIRLKQEAAAEVGEPFYVTPANATRWADTIAAYIAAQRERDAVATLRVDLLRDDAPPKEPTP